MTLPLPRWREDKDPADVLDYGFDFGEFLALSTPADSISSASWTVPAGLTDGDQAVVGNEAVIFLSGGVAGTVYTVTCRIVTVGGRTVERSATLYVRER